MYKKWRTPGLKIRAYLTLSYYDLSVEIVILYSDY